jgi:hypothetical protein
VRKKLTLSLLLILFVGLSTGATLEDFSYFPSQDFQYDFAGGETFFVEANFTNAANQNVPLGVEVVVDGEDHPMSSSGDEFDITGSVSDPDGSADYVDLVQKSYENTSEGLGVYRLGLKNNQQEVVEGLNSLDLEFKSDARIKPDNYMFDISIRSVVGFGDTKNLTVTTGEGPQTVSFEDTGSSVSLNPGVENVSVNVTQLDSVTVSPPEQGSNFVGGFTVDKDDQEKDLSGSVTLTYDDESLSERDVNVHYFDDSDGSWENVGGTHYPSNNSVVAQVDHFSTYAAYAEPEPQPTFTPGFDPAEEEQVNETNQTEDQPVNDTEDGTDEEEQPPEDDDQQQQEETEEGEDTGQGQTPVESPGQGQGLTGLFTSNPGSTALGLIALLVAVAAVLQYTGRYNFLEGLKAFRS